MCNTLRQSISLQVMQTYGQLAPLLLESYTAHPALKYAFIYLVLWSC